MWKYIMVSSFRKLLNVNFYCFLFDMNINVTIKKYINQSSFENAIGLGSKWRLYWTLTQTNSFNNVGAICYRERLWAFVRSKYKFVGWVSFPTSKFCEQSICKGKLLDNVSQSKTSASVSEKSNKTTTLLTVRIKPDYKVRAGLTGIFTGWRIWPTGPAIEEALAVGIWKRKATPIV